MLASVLGSVNCFCWRVCCVARCVAGLGLCGSNVQALLLTCNGCKQPRVELWCSFVFCGHHLCMCTWGAARLPAACCLRVVSVHNVNCLHTSPRWLQRVHGASVVMLCVWVIRCEPLLVCSVCCRLLCRDSFQTATIFVSVGEVASSQTVKQGTAHRSSGCSDCVKPTWSP